MSQGVSGGTDLVVMSLEPWDEVWRRNQHLVAEMMRARPDTRVLFVEPVSDPLHDLRRGVGPRRGRGLRAAPPPDGVGPGRIWLFQPTKALPRRVDPSGDRRRSAAVRRAARSIGITRPVLWVNDPYGATVSRETGWPTLYDITDDWTTASRGSAESRRILEADQFLVETAAAVTVCSPVLVSRKEEFRPVVLVSNGVDVEHYRRPTSPPTDLPRGRTAVYVGTLHADRLDLELCEETARALGDTGSLVLVGPNSLTRSDTDRLLDAGVVLLGPRPYDQVPAYLQHADLLVVPHVVDAFTDSLDPIKLYEYRAVGRPVVSTPVAGFRDTSDPHVTVSADVSFPTEVRSALQGGPPSSGGHDSPAAPEPIPTWARQAELMADVIRDVRHSSATHR
ncbi:glycosyltransferase [Isoptericola croceus]|uniref:glycosyltransferase n=1 Tax=Isoptericola croceus TaxID=3031406 RepID=UPI0023F626EB|nr:glycosyltransferase [Isoptericola croceus]